MTQDHVDALTKQSMPTDGSVRVVSREGPLAGEMSWSKYALAYDLMAKNNPAYQELLESVRSFCERHIPCPPSLVLDIGAGTGNFSTLLALRFPTAVVTALEPDAQMLASAIRKTQELRIGNIMPVQQRFEDYECEPGMLDVVTAVHSIYTLQEPVGALGRVFEWLRPGGLFFLCDLGKVLDVKDWGRYLFKELCRRRGIVVALSLLIRGRSIRASNLQIAELQRRGSYWTHDLGELRAACEEQGFRILEAFDCYRGYSQAVACEKPKDDLRVDSSE